jgi:2-dehydro-3-deoxy-D-arabinonate dehydratase
MKLYKIKNDIIIEAEGQFYLLKNENWDKFVNNDDIFGNMMNISKSQNPVENVSNILNNIDAPIQSQELWASGVTYLKSKRGRQQESKKAGGGDFYAHVYTAERPELFFKATKNRIANPGGKVRIRKDSTWNVPEPELTLMITSSGKIVGYTIGNDMSSRSIEGENPLYLPQAKTYDGCAAIGPCIYITEKPLSENTNIYMEVTRKGEHVFQGEVQIKMIKRNLKDLVSFLYLECTFPNGSLLMTGTGIVPTNDFTLQSGDKILITIQPIGTLINEVE